MNIYLISSQEIKLTSEQEVLLKAVGSFQTIVHKGKLAEIEVLKSDTEPKIIGLDPDVVEWNLEVEDLKQILNVQAVCTQSTSFAWVHPETLEAMGIAVVNVSGFSTDSVAEYAIVLAIESARRLPLHLKNKNVDWSAQSMLLKGKKLGIIGLGHIGHRIAEIGKGLGMEVIYWSKNTRDEAFVYKELSNIFTESDVLIPALKDDEETKTLITKELIDSLKPSAIVVGLGRIKNLFDEKHVISRVEENKLGGYAFEGENAKEIASNSNIWGVPPIAWYTEDSVRNLIDGWVKNIAELAKKKV